MPHSNTGIINVQGSRSKGGTVLLRSLKKRLKGGMLSADLGRIVIQIIRRGDGSFSRQFAQQSTIEFQGAVVPWRKSLKFGSRRVNRKTLQRSGALRRAWLGGSGSSVQITQRSVNVGVDTSIFPRAGVFQSKDITIIRASAIGAKGRTQMHWLFGMKYGVWISDSKLIRGLRIHSRQLSINRIMLGRIKKTILNHIITGKKPTVNG